MNFLNANSFLELAGKLKTKYIHPSELGLDGGVFIRELTGAERERIMKAGGKFTMFEDGSKEFDMSNMRTGATAELAVCALVVPSHDIEFGDDGYPLGEVVEYTQMFLKSKQGDLRKMGSEVLDVISRNVRELSGMTKEAIDEKKEN